MIFDLHIRVDEDIFFTGPSVCGSLGCRTGKCIMGFQCDLVTFRNVS
jgi:hypothetical protein